jgi:CheY-like chemotaxis protein
LLVEILRGLGIRWIHEASDGAEGLKLVQGRGVDLIFTDLAMRPMNGIDFVRQLRRSADGPNQFTPVIMITGHSTVARVAEARDAGVSEFLAKPFHARGLVEKLHRAVQQPRAFVQQADFCGPDRRRRPDPNYTGPARRPGDAA